MIERAGKAKASASKWGLVDIDRVEQGPALRSVPITKRFWWPHPCVRFLWRTMVVGHRYFDANGREMKR